MKPTQNIKPGDRVIAKMRGWNYWPARVLKMKGTPRKRKYEVQFFCTFDTAVVQEGRVLHFNGETKKKLRCNGNRRDVKKYLNVAIEEIEKDICMPPPTKIRRTSLSDSDALGLESSPGAASSGGALSVWKGSESAATSDQPRRPKSSGKVSPDIIDAPYQYLHSWMAVTKSLKSQTGSTKAVSTNARSSLSSVTLSSSSSPGLENFKNLDLNAESLGPPPALSAVIGSNETEKDSSSKSEPLVEDSTVEPVARCSGRPIHDELEENTTMGTDDQVARTADDSWSLEDDDDEDDCSSDFEDEDTRMINKFSKDHNISAKWEDEDPAKAWRKGLSTMSSPLDWFSLSQVHADAMAKPLPFKLDCEEDTPLYNKANKMLMEKQYGIDFDFNEWLANHGSSAPGGEAGPSPKALVLIRAPSHEPPEN